MTQLLWNLAGFGAGMLTVWAVIKGFDTGLGR